MLNLQSEKLKTLIKTLPTFEPRKESINQIVRQIVKRELRRWWERRVSILAGTVAVISGYFVLRQMFRIGEMLGTAGFWALVGTDKQWVLSDHIAAWEAFLEAHPWEEMGWLFLLLAILVFSLPRTQMPRSLERGRLINRREAKFPNAPTRFASRFDHEARRESRRAVRSWVRGLYILLKKDE